MEKMTLIGQKFNKLTVLNKAPSKGKNSYWHCKCDCGNEVDVRRDVLINGITKSCGCYRQEVKSNNLIGKRFGKLTVIAKTDKRHNQRVIWLCQCDCGNKVEVRTDYLTQGHTSSCGCLGKSKGEWKIAQILKENNINFEQQKIFETCRFPDTNALAKFDFYLPDYNVLIEYDGEQHYIEKNLFGGEEEFLKRKFNDKFKNQWCKENNIFLIRIPYTHYNNLCVEDLLLNSTFKL